MDPKFSYGWYITQFEKAKETAEEFILSVDEAQFSQPPAEGRWSVAKIYSHLINYGDLYFDDLAAGISSSEQTTEHPSEAYPPRWLVQKLVNFFEPPYNIKLKTVDAMKPDPVSGYDRMELLDEYINLQDRFIAQLEQGKHRHVDLNGTKMRHPLLSFVKMTLSEVFALAEVHQRRHQWQAHQTLEAIKKEL